MSPRRRPRIVSWIWRANAGDADLVHDVTESRRLEKSCRFVSSLLTTEDRLEPQRFSSWTKLTSTAAWVYRFIENCRSPVPIRRQGTIQPDEVSFAEIRIIRQA